MLSKCIFMQRKSALICYISLAGIIILLLLSSCKSTASRVNDVPVSVGSDHFNLSNVRQKNTDIKMQTINGKLYAYLPGNGNEKPSVYVFDDKGSSLMENILISNRYQPLWNDVVLGFGNGYMYVKRHSGKDHESAYPEQADLMWFDLATGANGILTKTEKAAYVDTLFDENGDFYISTGEISPGKEKRYQKVLKKTLLSDIFPQPDARTGTVSEVLEKYNDIVQMLDEKQLNSALESVEELGLDGYRCVLYPRSDGWLIHISTGSTPLCFVASNGVVTSVFEYACMDSASSFNYYGDYGFLSVKRYEQWDSMNYRLLPYENDTISGFYRINLTNYTAEKISDVNYRGIFIFDKTSLFVCDNNGGIYQLDSNGNVMTTLVNPYSEQI